MGSLAPWVEVLGGVLLVSSLLPMLGACLDLPVVGLLVTSGSSGSGFSGDVRLLIIQMFLGQGHRATAQPLLCHLLTLM